MKIGLYGYGKMGKAIEAIAFARGHEVVWRINRENADTTTQDLIRMADVVIEFSRPESAYEHVTRCLHAGIPVITGTTGWIDQLPMAEQWCNDHQGAMLWASNFSIGVNLFFALNKQLAALLKPYTEYKPSIKEIHHVHKLDAPSGTAITLAQGIEHQGFAPPDIESERIGEVPGTHIIAWESPIDTIRIEHDAHNRQGFALGAVVAAEWIQGRTGVFSMADVVG